MTQFVLDLFFSTVFIILLILLYKAKERIFTRNDTCYRYTHSGLLTLCVVALIQTSGHQGLLHNVPFLSEEVYRNLVEAIGIVTGVTLMIAGASFWLPGNRKESETEIEASHGEIPTDIHESILTSDGAQDIFKKTLEKICRQYQFAGYAVYRFSSVRGKFLCTDCNNLSHAQTVELKKVSIDTENTAQDFERISEEFGLSCGMPLRIGDRIGAGVFFMRDNGTELTEEETLQLNHIGDSISNRLTRKYHTAKNEFYESCWINLQRLTRLNNHRGGLRDHLGGIYEIFKNAIGTEYICMANFDESRGQFRRYAVGINGNVLLDSAVMPDLRSTHFETVLNSGRSLVIDDIGLVEDIAIDSLFLSCAQTSLMAVPIYHGGKISAVVTLGSPRIGTFNRRHQFIARLLCYSLKPALSVESSRLTRNKAVAHMDSLYAFGRTIDADTDLNRIFEHTAEYILSSLETTMVRIHLVSANRKSLRGAITHTCRPISLEERDGFSVDPETTPHYRTVIDDKEIAVLNIDGDEDGTISREFDAADLGNMKSAILLPVVVNGLTTAVITVADMRQDNRSVIDTEDLTWLGCVVDKVGMTLRIMNMGRMVASLGSGSEMREGPRRLKINLKGASETASEIIPAVRDNNRDSVLSSGVTFDRESFRDSIEESRRNIAELVETADTKDI